MASSGLGGKILDVLRRWIEGALKFVLDIIFYPIELFIIALGELLGKHFQTGSTPDQNILRRLKARPELRDIAWQEAQKAGGLGKWFVFPILYFVMVLTSIGALSSVMLRPSLQLLNVTFPDELPSLSDLIVAWQKDNLSKSTLREVGLRQGVSTDFTDTILASSFQYPDFGQISALALRGHIDPVTANRWLRYNGFHPDAAKLLPELFFYIPPVPDLIQMAVREAFTPDIASKFGQYEDFPAQLAQYGAMQGVSPEWAQRYWAAHWDLPSPMQGFEMLHRGVIDQGTLNMLLRALDVMPFWRDKLTAIAYNPYTRVDVRRMFKAGVIDLTAVNRAYRDLGYDPQKAEHLTAFTASLAETNEGEIAKGDIVDAYKRKMFDRPTAKKMLVDIGNDEITAEFYLNRVDFIQVSEKKKQVVANVKTRFQKGTIDENEVIARLGAINLLSDEILEYLELWKSTRGAKVFNLPIGDLKKFFKEGIINEDEFKVEMVNRGTPAKYVGWYVESLNKGIELPSLSEEVS